MFYYSGKHDEAVDEHRSDCYCRVRPADLELVGRSKGTETHAMQSLVQNIVFRMAVTWWVAPAACDLLSMFTDKAELQKQKHISGIPPPIAEQLSTSEHNHVA
jgi:hypothetical protein